MNNVGNNNYRHVEPRENLFFDKNESVRDRLIRENQSRLDHLGEETIVYRSEDSDLVILLEWGYFYHNAFIKDLPCQVNPSDKSDREEYLYRNVDITIIVGDKVIKGSAGAAFNPNSEDYHDGQVHWELDYDYDDEHGPASFIACNLRDVYELTENELMSISNFSCNITPSPEQMKEAFFYRDHLLIKREGGGEPLFIKQYSVNKALQPAW